MMFRTMIFRISAELRVMSSSRTRCRICRRTLPIRIRRVIPILMLDRGIVHWTISPLVWTPSTSTIADGRSASQLKDSALPQRKLACLCLRLIGRSTFRRFPATIPTCNSIIVHAASPLLRLSGSTYLSLRASLCLRSLCIWYHSAFVLPSYRSARILMFASRARPLRLLHLVANDVIGAWRLTLGIRLLWHLTRRPPSQLTLVTNFVFRSITPRPNRSSLRRDHVTSRL